MCPRPTKQEKSEYKVKPLKYKQIEVQLTI